MKALRTLALLLALTFIPALNSPHAQTVTTPTPTPEQTTTLASSGKTQQTTMTPREKREVAYAKLLEGQRFLMSVRRNNPESGVRAARQSFQEAASLDPTLAEAHTALAEIAFFFPPYDLDQAITEAQTATRIDPNNFGGHRLLSRIYSIRSGLRENSLNKDYVEKAIVEWREVARLDKNNSEAWALLGEFYMATGRANEAIGAFTNWAAAPPATDMRFYHAITNGRELSPDAAAARLGEALMNAGRTSEAITAFKRAMALDPENQQYAELLAQAYEAGGEADSNAIAELQRMVTTDPDNLNLVKLLARAQARAGQIDEAAKTFRAAISRRSAGDREQFMLRLNLAQLYTDYLRTTEAIAAYDELLKERGIGDTLLRSPQDREFASAVLRRVIDLQVNAGRIVDATATVERMRRLLGKDDPAADAQYISLLRNQGKRREALTAIRAARTAHPDDVSFLYLESLTLADLGRFDEAVALLRTRLSGAFEDFDIYVRLSGIYSQANRGREAVESARSALQLVPNERQDLTAAALITLSSAQQGAGDFKSAEESLRRVLTMEPANATALNNLGYFLVERGERLQEALELIQRAVRAEPTNSSFLDSLGWAYFKLNKLEEAERYLSEAARRDATSATIQEHLGDVYQSRGKMDLARTAWQKALTLATNTTDLSRIKTKLDARTKSRR